MAAFPKFDRSLIPGVPETLATLATLAGGEGISQKTPIIKKTAETQQKPGYWEHFYNERAAILEHDHELPRSEAEARAWAWTVTEWLNQNPAPSEPDQCAWCGKPADVGKIVPFGAEATWLHHACWKPWYDDRRDKAHKALSQLLHKKRLAPQGERQPKEQEDYLT